MKKVILIGAGGHGKVVADIVRCCGDEVLGFLDDKRPDALTGFHILGTTDDVGSMDDVWYFPAIGNASVREKIVRKNPNARWYTAIHPSAVIAKDASVGQCSCVMANAVINSGARIGTGCIINTAATVDHDCLLDDFVHICPGAHVAGTVEIGRRVWVGIGASIVNNISIFSDVTVGAGATVISSINCSGTYVGTPAVLINGGGK